MKQKEKLVSVFLAILAAVFYAINTPFSKILLDKVSPTFMAAFLYLGAGIGVGAMYLFQYKNEKVEERIGRQDWLYVLGMIVLDIAAPIFLMIGIRIGTASNASLLGNFEIVATTLIALLLFKETVTKRLWISIGFITLSSILLTFDGQGSFQFSLGSLFVILATSCWGLENNCTRKISDKSTYQIVCLKGIFSGGGSFFIALFLKEAIPDIKEILAVMLLGFVSYGLSIFFYIRAQRGLGAAKTSAYYAIAPFVGAILSFVFNSEFLTPMYFISLIFMVIGTVYIVRDTIIKNHTHIHTHVITHTHNGSTHTHVITHEHPHDHFTDEEKHFHKHNDFLKSDIHRLEHEKNSNYF
jgi:hypothetical protein